MRSIGFPQNMKNRHSDVELPQSNVTVVEIWDPTTTEKDIEVVEQDLIHARSSLCAQGEQSFAWNLRC
jgi:hypothetical protein